MESLQLNVVLHGPFMLFLYRDYVRAITADIEGHVYAAGTWLREKPLPEGPYCLTIKANQSHRFGSGSGTPGYDPASLPVVSAVDFGLYEADPNGKGHCSLILPIPEYISTCHRVPVNNIFSGQHSGPVNDIVKYLGNVQVLQYTIKSLSDVNLDPFPWIPEPCQGFPDCTNLHIYSEVAVDMGMAHSVNAFRQQVELAPGLSLFLHQPPAGKQVGDNLPHGVTPGEVLGFRPEPPSHLISIPPLVCDATSVLIKMPSS